MKKIIFGFIIGVITCSVIGVVASYVCDVADFKVIVNGSEFVSEQPILDVDGRTYLPLKAIGDVLDIPVYWNEEKYQVEIGTPSNNKKTESISTPTIQSNTFSPTVAEQNAVKKAQSYLKFTSFSYSGLIDQLKFEGFTTSEATFGVNNCGADWNEQAVKKAESYLSYSSFSKKGLIEQLEFEGFTHAQAVYGVEQNGFN